MHYLRYGYRDWRDPSTGFSLKRYAELTGWTPEQGEPLKIFLKTGLPGAPNLRAVDPTRPSHRINLGSDAARPYCEGSMLRYPLSYRPAERTAAHGNFVPNRMVLHWVIPDFGTGGGGHMTIFRMVRALGLRGHRQTVWIHNRGPNATGTAAYDNIVRHYQTIDAEVRLIENGGLAEAEGDAVIATDWGSVWPARTMRG